jgi:hypothetical protein
MALRCYRFRERSALPSLFGFAPGVVCHAVSVAGNAVRSYRTFSPLLRPRTERFVLCGTVPGVTPAGRYPAPYVDGARTFLSRSLSTVAGAAVRPTDATGMAAESRQVKPITRRRSSKKISQKCRSATRPFDFMSARYAAHKTELERCCTCRCSIRSRRAVTGCDARFIGFAAKFRGIFAPPL